MPTMEITYRRTITTSVLLSGSSTLKRLWMSRFRWQGHTRDTYESGIKQKSQYLPDRRGAKMPQRGGRGTRPSLQV